jgi:hypothetical protein
VPRSPSRAAGGAPADRGVHGAGQCRRGRDADRRRRRCCSACTRNRAPKSSTACARWRRPRGSRWPRGRCCRPAHLNRCWRRPRAPRFDELINMATLRSMTQAYYSPRTSAISGWRCKLRAFHLAHPALCRPGRAPGADLGASLGQGRAECLGYRAAGRDRPAHLETERRSMAAERDTTDRYLAAFLADRVGSEFPAGSPGVARFGLFVKLDETGADGLVPIRTLGDEYFRHDRDRTSPSSPARSGPISTAPSRTRGSRTAAALRDHGRTWPPIEARYGVEKEVVARSGGWKAPTAAARHDADHRIAGDAGLRGAAARVLREQLIAALRSCRPATPRPSGWSAAGPGAMGHTQFIPTSYLAYAVDFTGDGRRDIWSDDPTDALASAAAPICRASAGAGASPAGRGAAARGLRPAARRQRAPGAGLARAMGVRRSAAARLPARRGDADVPGRRQRAGAS